MRYNPLTLRHDFLDITAAFKDSHTKQRVFEKEAEAKGSSSRGSGSAGATSAAAAVDAALGGQSPPPPAKGDNTGGVGNAGKPPKKGPKRKTGNPEDPKAADGEDKKGGKGDNKQIKKGKLDYKGAGQARDRFLRETGEATSLVGLIQTDAEWSWARNDTNVGQIKAKAVVEKFRASSEFYKALIYNPDWKKAAQADPDQATLAREMARLADFNKCMDRLHKIRGMVLATHQTRKDALMSD